MTAALQARKPFDPTLNGLPTAAGLLWAMREMYRDQRLPIRTLLYGHLLVLRAREGFVPDDVVQLRATAGRANLTPQEAGDAIAELVQHGHLAMGGDRIRVVIPDPRSDRRRP